MLETMIMARARNLMAQLIGELVTQINDRLATINEKFKDIDKKPVVKFRKIRPEARLPEYKSPGAAGMDLYASLHSWLRPHQIRVISSGVAIELPPGYEAQVRSRSSLASKGIVVANSPGTVDSDYQGEVGVILYNTTDDDFFIDEGDRIAQLVIARVSQAVVEESTQEPEATARGTGGFGSTGR